MEKTDFTVNLFPKRVMLEDIPMDVFDGPESFIQRLIYETRQPTQSVIFYINVHGTNLAYRNKPYKHVLQQGDIVFCDGAGVMLAAFLLGEDVPVRLTVMDWLFEMLEAFAEENLRVLFLAGEPGVGERALRVFDQRIPSHTVVGMHHGYILDDPDLEKAAIAYINELRPDILFLGMGMPLQELWIDRHRHELNVRVICCIGAALDYIGGKIPRCPAWMGKIGFEWLFRLWSEPRRLFHRYVVGNPWFISRILYAVMRQKLCSGLREVNVFSKNWPSQVNQDKLLD